MRCVLGITKGSLGVCRSNPSLFLSLIMALKIKLIFHEYMIIIFQLLDSAPIIQRICCLLGSGCFLNICCHANYFTCSGLAG